MNGSEKQVKWAEDIKSGKLAKFEEIKARSLNNIGRNAADYIINNDHASFWIDTRGTSALDMLRALLTTGLDIYGSDYGRRAKLDAKTGILTEESCDIVDQTGKVAMKWTTISTIDLSK